MLGSGGLWSRLAHRLCNCGKGQGEARLAPHSIPRLCPCAGQQREEPASAVPDSAGPSRSPHGSVSPCHAVVMSERGGSMALSASPTASSTGEGTWRQKGCQCPWDSQSPPSLGVPYHHGQAAGRCYLTGYLHLGTSCCLWV